MPSHFVPSRTLSSGWTGTILYALWISIFAISVLLPSCSTTCATSSIPIYFSTLKPGSIPLLTLFPVGLERSTIRCHLPGLSPNRLIWMPGISSGEIGPTTRPNATSSCRYHEIISGCVLIDSKFVLAN